MHLGEGTGLSFESLQVAGGLPSQPRAPIVTVFNKLDRASAASLAALRNDQPGASFISATNGDGIVQLLARLTDSLPEGPFLYPEEDISTQQTRYFTAELIRATALEQLGD